MTSQIASCEVTDRCPRGAVLRVSIAGRLKSEGPPVNSCWRHAPLIIREYLKISDDVRARKPL